MHANMPSTISMQSVLEKIFAHVLSKISLKEISAVHTSRKK